MVSVVTHYDRTAHANRDASVALEAITVHGLVFIIV
jgi:hypothetical protein